ncbi:MAG: hypothetical protein C4329_12405 [Chitinophagaceae bacterium]
MNDQIQIKEIIIREHYQIIADFMKGLHESEYSFFDKTAAWKDIEESYMRHIIEMQEECEGTCLVVFENEYPIGFIFGYVEEQDDSRIEAYEGDELYISDGYVLPTYRKQGIYKRMNEQLEQKYIAQGIKRITRFTLVNNEPMKHFLASSGYQPTRILFEKWL